MSELETPPLQSYLPRFGLSAFREGQEQVISTVLSGRDCLCVMPTGGGKSLCYQLPALALDGLTLVVSPLIALMKDQVDQLETLGIPVSFINSTLPQAEQYSRLNRMAAGEFRLVYVVPERFRSNMFLEAVQAIGVKLLAIDEAHCISEWGHDFRPDYARLGHFRHKMGRPPTIALTATATDRVRRDIIEQLDLQEPKTFITGFARPNLFYEVQTAPTDRQKADMLVSFLNKTPGSGIIYTSTRKRAEEVAEQLAGKTRRRAVVYHAGLMPDQRHKAQEDFMEGRNEIVVATNAFGMGIDKANVRFVVHYNIPGSLEAYYQEAGRAGRDGDTSHCLMFYHASDRYIQEYFIENAYPSREDIQAVYEYLCEIEENPIELTQDEIKQSLGLSIGGEGVGNCEKVLESGGALERLIASQNMASVRIDSNLPTLVDLLPKQARVQRKVIRSIEQIVGDRRQELVQFNLRDLSVNDDMDQTSITNALRELNRLESFTYVPPFRGRGIRMIDREKPFDELDIDFEAIDRRRAAEFEKLDRVIRFALGGSCRQRTILQYFGEENAGDCGHCDNCRRQGREAAELAPHVVKSVDNSTVSPPVASQKAKETPTASHTDSGVLQAVQIVLSGVARIQSSRFSCGRTLIALMLCGSNSAKVTKLRFNQLSTFGMLKHLKQDEVLQLIDTLLAMQYLQQTSLDRFRPVIELTESGVEVMRGKTPLPADLPIPHELLRKLRGKAATAPPSRPVRPTVEPHSEPSVNAAIDSTDAAPDAELLTALKQWRSDVADEAGVPLYCILNNDTLLKLAHQRPTTAEELQAVNGVGPVKIARYGGALLAILGRQADGGPLQTSSEDREPAEFVPYDSEVADVPDSLEPPPSSYWTRRLLSAGFTVDECMAIRGLPRETVLEHARQSE